MARPIRSLIRSAASISSSRCSSFTNSISSSSSFDRTCCLSVSDCFSCLSRRASPEIRVSSSLAVSLVTDPALTLLFRVNPPSLVPSSSVVIAHVTRSGDFSVSVGRCWVPVRSRQNRSSGSNGSPIVDGPEVPEDRDPAQREAEGPRSSMDYSEIPLLDFSPPKKRSIVS